MFNVTVNLRRVIKITGIVIVSIVFFLIIIIMIKKYSKFLAILINEKYAVILDTELAINNYDRLDFKKADQKILSSELVFIDNINIEENDIQEEIKVEEAEEINIENDIDNIQLTTEVMQDKNIKEAYNYEYQGVKIKNESKYSLTDDILNPDIKFENRKVLIFHTHTCESYTQSPENKYKESSNFRTIDLNYSVSRVGDELTENLESKGFEVIHDNTYHDYPAYTGSYNRSYLTVKGILEEKPEIQTVIDLHRDAIGSKSEYGPAVKIGEERVAQLMFVIGTDGGGLSHPNWKNNLKYAIKIQQKANELYPGLFRPILVRNSRYNQNLADGAFIIEVGATGNTLEESIRKYEIFSRSF